MIEEGLSSSDPDPQRDQEISSVKEKEVEDL